MPGVCGYELEISGGWVFEIGNEWLTRRIHCLSERIGTTSLAHGMSGEEYLQETVEEFALTISKDSHRMELSYRDFRYAGHSLVSATDECRELEIDLECSLDDAKIQLSVHYQALAGCNYISKWIEIEPVEVDGWIIEWITIEHMRFRDVIEGIIPHSRYTSHYPNGEDNVHTDPDKADISDPLKRFNYGDHSRALVARWGLEEGLFFYTTGVLGSEAFDRTDGLLMRQKQYKPLSEGAIAAPAVLGAYLGPPEIGFKRYREYLSSICAAGDKPTPVEWNTWFITLKNNTPLFTNYDRNLLFDYLDLIKDAGFYDVLHLDLGWEAKWPLAVDKTKFPNGLDEIVRHANDYGLDMGFWINPFSSSYWKSDIEEEHPEWLNPEKVSGQSHAHAICPMTDYYTYVQQRLVELVERFKARIIYWDGGDWNIPYCSAANHRHSNQHELEVNTLARFSTLCDIIHDMRSDALIIAFNLPFDNHKLSALDKQQISDTHSFLTGKSELIQRQQIYQMTFEHPYRAIWGSWYGVNWHEAGEDNLNRPLRELIHAEMSMIGNGACQAGGSIDLSQAKPEFIEFLGKMFTWRRKFERYFTVYQHILGFPDGENVDGEGHIINGKGFLVLVNPKDEEQTVNLPLDEPELELSVGHRYEITDWSSFDQARPIGKVRIGEKFPIDFAPLEVKIIGIDIE